MLMHTGEKPFNLLLNAGCTYWCTLERSRSRIINCSMQAAHVGAHWGETVQVRGLRRRLRTARQYAQGKNYQ